MILRSTNTHSNSEIRLLDRLTLTDMKLISTSKSSTSIALYEAVHRLIGDEKLGCALELYLQTYPEQTARARTEWRLAEEIGKEPSELVDVNLAEWPASLLQRTSGAALCFLMNNINRNPTKNLPPGLAEFPALSGDRKVLLARAWNLFPEGVFEREERKKLSNWLSSEPRSVGFCLMAAAGLGDAQIVEELQSVFLRRCLSTPDMPALLRQMAGYNLLRELTRKVLKAELFLALRSPDQAFQLLQIAFEIEDFEILVACGEGLLSGSLSTKSIAQSRSMRLTALAETGRAREAINEYRNNWLEATEPFPYPDSLLRIFQRFGEKELQTHLLSNLPTDRKEFSCWVALSRETEIAAKPVIQLVEEWTASIERDPRDPNAFIGLTEAILGMPFIIAPGLMDRIKERWQRLSTHEEVEHQGWAVQAVTYSMLLKESAPDRIAYFERELVRFSPDDPMVHRASFEYLRCLRQLKQWAKIRAFLTSPHGQILHRQCDFSEFEFIRMMSDLDDVPRDETQCLEWCEKWERLLRLPLDTRQIEELTGHFAKLTDKTPAHLSQSHLFHDLELQVLRRAKAEAERVLRHNRNVPASIADGLSQRLCAARIQGAHEILSNLAPYEGQKHRGRNN